MANPHRSVIREARGQWAVVDWSKGGATAAINTVSLHSSEADAKRATREG